MECTICKCWVEIEEPNPTDVPGFVCDECLETPVWTAKDIEEAKRKAKELHEYFHPPQD